MKRAVVLLLVAAAILSTVGRLSAQEVPEISRTIPERPRLAVPEINSLSYATPRHLNLIAPEIEFLPTRVAVANISAVGRLRLGGTAAPSQANPWMLTNTGGQMTLLARKNASLGLTGQRNGYPGMGFSSSVALGQTWQPADRVTIYGGVYASDNLFHRDRFKDLGVSGRVRLKVAERVALVGFGAYSLYDSAANGAGGANGHHLPPMMYPGHNYGGGVQLRLTDRFGLEGSVRRDYNVFTRKWETSQYIQPVFY